MTPDQVRSLLLAAKPSRYAPVFELLVNTGLRRGEALALHWSDIDLDAKLLRVRGTLARVAGELVVTKRRRRSLDEWFPSPLLRSGCCATYAPIRGPSG